MTLSVQESLAIGVASMACAYDLRSRRIPNALTFGAAVVAFAVATVGDGLGALGWCAAGWALAVALWLPIYALGGMGAGDVKLLGAIGAWLGPGAVLPVSMYSAVAGGGMAAILVVARRRVTQTCSNIQLLLTHWRVAGFSPHAQLTLERAPGPRLAYAVPVLVGTVVAIWLR